MKKKRQKIYVLMLVYGLLAAVIATCIHGAKIDIYIGLLLGIGSLMINYWLLAYMIHAITKKDSTFKIFPIGLGRFFIFGGAAWICFQQGHLCVILFAIGILALPIAALLLTLWEASDDSY